MTINIPEQRKLTEAEQFIEAFKQLCYQYVDKIDMTNIFGMTVPTVINFKSGATIGFITFLKMAGFKNFN